MSCFFYVHIIFKKEKQPVIGCFLSSIKLTTLSLNVVNMVVCGVGENRTLVHTSNKIVFYMLSFRLIFVVIIDRKQPMLPLSS